eukprot:gb/GFBE01082220.1/.p1 GENE.gb/GFBE01082220.1/~~gb/GFBE01082220.1/.p1  ORF type:complete len:679 (+),score=276.57 gb/GFBE01082220.1/:1-2037(+)
MQRACRIALTLGAVATGGEAFKAQTAGALVAYEEDASNGNPIRKVVAMMEKMAKKIEAEGEKEADLYDKFECYCKKTAAELETSIKEQETGPITQADIDSKEAEITSLEQEVATLKADRVEEEQSLKSAESQRSKEHEHFVEDVAEEQEVVAGVDSAVSALDGGATALLQGAKGSPRMLRALEQNQRLDQDERQRLTSFLAGDATADPGMVKGMLAGMKEDAVEEIHVDEETEDKSAHNFEEVESSKQTSISTLLEQFERKMKRIGELKVEVVNMKHAMEGAGSSLADDKKMLVDLQKNCAEKASAWEERKAGRAQEQTALQDTIKMLDSDESLDLFRGRASALLQVSANQEQAKAKALEFVNAAKSSGDARPDLNFLALALSGKKVDFNKVLEKIDSMVDLLKKEGKDDSSKKEYCNKEFHKTEVKSKELDQAIKSLTASAAQKEEAVDQLKAEIKALQDGVAELDASVAQAGENRKAESEEFQQSTAEDSSALQLLSMARDRLNQVYNPSMVAATTTKSPYDLALVQLAASGKIEQPPPTFEGDYKKAGQESNGVLSMIDTLKDEVEQGIAMAKVAEQNAQKEYEETLQDAAKKREADVALATQKAGTKADLEGDASDDKTEVKSKLAASKAASEYAANLHQECDWLLQNIDLRAQARDEEKENLIRAKTVLAGSA